MGGPSLAYLTMPETALLEEWTLANTASSSSHPAITPYHTITPGMCYMPPLLYPSKASAPSPPKTNRGPRDTDAMDRVLYDVLTTFPTDTLNGAAFFAGENPTNRKDDIVDAAADTFG